MLSSTKLTTNRAWKAGLNLLGWGAAKSSCPACQLSGVFPLQGFFKDDLNLGPDVHERLSNT